MTEIVKKTFIIFVYLLIILMIPIFLDYLFELTIRSKRLLNAETTARKIAKKSTKPVIVFNGLESGYIRQADGKNVDSVEDFTGDINDILNEMMDNSAVIILNRSVEYTTDPVELITDAKRVSGGDLFIVGLEKNSPRVFWDVNIINVMANPYYTNTDTEVKLIKFNSVQRKIRKIYSYLFKIIPIEFFKLH